MKKQRKDILHKPPKSGKAKAKRLKDQRVLKRKEAVRAGKVDRLSRSIRVNPQSLGPNRSYGIPEFVTRGYYLDMPFDCKDCGSAQIWRDTQQKWWYEVMKGDVWTVAVRCRNCRRKERARKANARAGQEAGLVKKRAKR